MRTKDLDEIIRLLGEKKEYLHRKYSVREIGVFGSYVRRDHRAASDLDILVEFEEPIGLLRFVELESELSEMTGVKVDLVSGRALKPHIGESIRREVVYI